MRPNQASAQPGPAQPGGSDKVDERAVALGEPELELRGQAESQAQPQRGHEVGVEDGVRRHHQRALDGGAVSAQQTAATQSMTWTQLTHWFPLPIRPPRQRSVGSTRCSSVDEPTYCDPTPASSNPHEA